MPPFRHPPLEVIGPIRQDLRDRYHDGFTILKELLQNADGAGTSEPSKAASDLVLLLPSLEVALVMPTAALIATTGVETIG